MNARKRRAALVRALALAQVIALLAIISSGCASILKGETMSVAPHTGAVSTMQPGSAPEVSDYDELKAALLELVTLRAESGQILVNSYGGDDIYADIDRACDEIKTQDPMGAFALTDISVTVTQIVSYLELDAELTYKRTKKQMDSVISVPTMQYLRTELLRFMRDYIGEVVIGTDVRGITPEEIEKAVRELYYANPLSTVMLPSVGIEVFPPDKESGERLFELSFNFNITTSLLASYNRDLRETVSTIARTVGYGENGEESGGMLLLELARRLAESCVYNEKRAAMLAVHGVQDFDATAYGALLSASAVGEGYAMAYKALCDELELECFVVLGTLDGAAHAWNIVGLDGDYYHVDVAMCSKNGLDTAFLLRDEDMPEQYEWDRRSAKACDGELTYYDFAQPEAEEADAEVEPEANVET